MSLPANWVTKIFEKCTLVYGQPFLRKWEGIDLNAVKSDWAHELAGFAQSPKAIAYALENLPEKPPTVLEFRALCRAAPRAPEVAKIEGPPADPERVAAELRKLSPIVKNEAGKDYKAWARRILERKRAGESIPVINVELAKEALRARDD